MHQTCLSYSKNILWKWRDGLCRESLENTDCCFKVFCCCLVTKSCLRSFVIPWTIARQHPLYMGLSGREYWSGLSFPSLGQVPDPGVEPPSSALASRFFTTEPPGKPLQPFSVPTISWYFYHDKLFMVPCIKIHKMKLYESYMSKADRVCGGGKDWEPEVSRCKLLHINWINNKSLLYSTGNYVQYFVISYKRKESEKKIYMYV